MVSMWTEIKNRCSSCYQELLGHAKKNVNFVQQHTALLP